MSTTKTEASTPEALAARVSDIAQWLQNSVTYIAGRGFSAAAKNMFAQAGALREIATQIRAMPDAGHESLTSLTDIILATQDADTLRDLLKVWAGSAHSRPELADHDRLRVLESAFTRFLRIEAAHEGDGR